MQSGTAATVIRLEDVPEGALDLEPLMENIRKQERLKLTVEDLENDIDWEHIAGVGKGTVERILVKYVPILSPHRPDVEKTFTETHKKHPLRLRKTDVQSLRCSSIDESTTVGTWQVLRDIVFKQLGIAKEWLNNKIIIACGDQLTIQRLRKVKIFRSKAASAAARCDCFLPVIQLWHMKWAWMKAIFRLGYRPDFTGRGVFGMYQDCVLLGREKFNHKTCDFYPGHGILLDRFEALVLEAFRYVVALNQLKCVILLTCLTQCRLICQEETGLDYNSSIPLVQNIGKYFEEGGPLAKCSYGKIQSLSSRVYDRYLSFAAYEAAGDERTWLSGNFGSIANDTVHPPSNPEPSGDITTTPASETTRASQHDGAEVQEETSSTATAATETSTMPGASPAAPETETSPTPGASASVLIAEASGVSGSEPSTASGPGTNPETDLGESECPNPASDAMNC